jgi:hypothetical protein
MDTGMSTTTTTTTTTHMSTADRIRDFQLGNLSGRHAPELNAWGGLLYGLELRDAGLAGDRSPIGR